MLSKVPQHIFITHEFDYFYRDTNDYANLLKKHGKLTEILANPGNWHMSQSSEQDMDTLFKYL